MSDMGRYLAIYRLTVRNSLIREMSFKLNFLLWMVVELLWFAGQLAFIEVLYGQVDAIAGWTKWQVVALVGVHQIISQLFQAFFYMNLANLPELVRSGRLDLMLTLPVDAQFAISTRQISFDSLVNTLVGTGIVAFALSKLGIVPGAAQLALAAVTIVFGVSVHYALLLALSCISFWSVRAQFIHGYFHVFMLGRMPEAVFRGVFRLIFTWIIPVIWVSNLPTQILVRPFESPWPGMAALASGTCIVLGLSRALWLFALRRYASASS
jgi:ABC-2 type transport system permease protein